MRYRSGRCSVCGSSSLAGVCNWGDIFLSAVLDVGTLFERSHSLSKVEYFPEGNSNIQDADAGNCSTHPSRSDHRLQRMQAGLTRGIQQEIIVAPVAEAERALRNPRQQR